jgi:hypothetical protein
MDLESGQSKPQSQPLSKPLMAPMHLSDSRQLDVPRAPRRGGGGCRFVGLSLVFLVGIVCGALVTILYGLTISGTRGPISTPNPPQTSDFIIQVGRAYITHAIERDLNTSGTLNASDVQVTMATGDQMTITGNDQIVLGVTTPFQIVVQPVIVSCQLQIHIMQVSVGTIGVTQVAATFESQANQQLQTSSSALPAGFTYCKTSVRTDPQNMYVTFSATPTS